jgi:low temperature requirement protein LtrA
MGDQAWRPEQRVTPLELFFDLVFVYATTQITSLLSASPTWGGLFQASLVFGVLWWAWSGYAWVTNSLDPEEGVVRLAMFAATAAMLIAALAVPNAFGADGVIFGVAYLIVRLVHLVILSMAAHRDRDRKAAAVRTIPASTIAPALLIVAGFTSGSAQMALWCAALGVTYLTPLFGHMRGFNVSPAHFVERFGLIVIIALGESIAAIGIGARHVPLDAGVISAALLGFVVAACIWWSYFDWVIYVAQAILTEATGNRRATLARDLYTYLHLPMVMGIVLFAFGLRTVVGDVGASLQIVPATCLCGGVALYMLAHVALRLRIHGGFGRGRPVAGILLLASIPLATHIPGLATLGIVAGICVLMIAYEVLRHRGARAEIRARRGSFSVEELRRVTREEPPEPDPGLQP